MNGMHRHRFGEEAGDSVIYVRLLMPEDVCAGSGAVNRGRRRVSAEYRYAQSQRRSFRRGGRVERRPRRDRFPPDSARHGIRDARFHGHRRPGLPQPQERTFGLGMSALRGEADEDQRPSERPLIANSRPFGPQWQTWRATRYRIMRSWYVANCMSIDGAAIRPIHLDKLPLTRPPLTFSTMIVRLNVRIAQRS